MKKLSLFFIVVMALVGCRPEPPRPQLEVTQYPAYGEADGVVKGRAVNLTDPTDYAVGILGQAKDSVWYPKDKARLAADGTFEGNLYSNPDDPQQIVKLVAILMPWSEAMPDCFPTVCLEVLEVAGELDRVVVERPSPKRVIEFAGQPWVVDEVGPAGNQLGTQPNQVWVDAQGLHLTISQTETGSWLSTEVALAKSQPLGYGIYRFATKGRLDLLDANAVLGMFLWDAEAIAQSHRELDIEFSRWGNSDWDTNAQFVVHPCDACPGCGNCYRFGCNNFGNDEAVHFIIWAADQVHFITYVGSHTYEWSYRGDAVPVPGNETVYLNLWLVNDQPPLSGRGEEVVISDFSFEPFS